MQSRHYLLKSTITKHTELFPKQINTQKQQHNLNSQKYYYQGIWSKEGRLSPLVQDVGLGQKLRVRDEDVVVLWILGKCTYEK